MAVLSTTRAVTSAGASAEGSTGGPAEGSAAVSPAEGSAATRTSLPRWPPGSQSAPSSVSDSGPQRTPAPPPSAAPAARRPLFRTRLPKIAGSCSGASTRMPSRALSCTSLDSSTTSVAGSWSPPARLCSQYPYRPLLLIRFPRKAYGPGVLPSAIPSPALPSSTHPVTMPPRPPTLVVPCADTSNPATWLPSIEQPVTSRPSAPQSEMP